MQRVASVLHTQVTRTQEARSADIGLVPFNGEPNREFGRVWLSDFLAVYKGAVKQNLLSAHILLNLLVSE